MWCAPCAALLIRAGGWEWRLGGGRASGWWQRESWILKGELGHPLLRCSLPCKECHCPPMGCWVATAHLRGALLSALGGDFCCLLRLGRWGKWTLGGRNLMGTPRWILCNGFSRTWAVDLTARPIGCISCLWLGADQRKGISSKWLKITEWWRGSPLF